MILGSERQLEIGRVYNSRVSDASCDRWIDQTFVVLREATMAEWEEFARLAGTTETLIETVTQDTEPQWFYEIATD